MRVFCAFSGLRISRALRMCALMYRTWTTPLSVIAATRSCGQATRVQPGARRALYLVSGIPIKRSLASQMVRCHCEPLPCSARKVDSEYGVDVFIDSADERSCVVSCASGYSIVADPAVRTRMTNGSWTDGGLSTCEPQAYADLSLGSSVVSDCDGTLYGHTCTGSCASGYVTSDISLLQVYQMGLFPGASCWFALVRNSTAWRVSRTLATVLVSVIIAEQKAPMVWLKLTRVCGTTVLPSFLTILLFRAHQSADLPPSHQQVPVTIATVSLYRKNALPLAQRATRLSRVQQH